MCAALASSLFAAELADYLVKKDLLFRDVHQLVGRAAQMVLLASLEWKKRCEPDSTLLIRLYSRRTQPPLAADAALRVSPTEPPISVHGVSKALYIDCRATRLKRNGRQLRAHSSITPCLPLETGNRISGARRANTCAIHLFVHPFIDTDNALGLMTRLLYTRKREKNTSPSV